MRNISVAGAQTPARVGDTELTTVRSMNILVPSAVAVSLWSASTAVAPAPSSSNDAPIEISSAKTRTSNSGAQTNFTGHAQVEQLFPARGASRLTGGVVNFQPSARSAWHTHPLASSLRPAPVLCSNGAARFVS